MSYTTGYALYGGTGALTNVSGRATDKNNVLSVSGGNTISFATSTIESKELKFALCEYDEDGNIISAGQKAQAWLSTCTLQTNTRYVLIAFKNGDGTTEFTATALNLLPSCLTIS